MQFEPDIDTLEDAAEHLSGVYIPMYGSFGPQGYLEYYTEILGPEVHAKVLSYVVSYFILFFKFNLFLTPMLFPFFLQNNSIGSRVNLQLH